MTLDRVVVEWAAEAFALGGTERDAFTGHVLVFKERTKKSQKLHARSEKDAQFRVQLSTLPFTF